MRSLIVLILLITLVVFGTFGQRFSEDKVKFRAEAIDRLESVGTESARKIAYDFRNAWDGKFTSVQQDKIHSIVLTMQKKGYEYYPYFYHYFTYLAYSVAQENLDRDALDNVIEINEQAVHSLSKEEYKEFVFGLNIFMARRYLSLDKNLSVQVPEGSYNFRLIGESIEIVQDREQVAGIDSIDFFSTPQLEEEADENGWDTGSTWDNGGGDDTWDNSWTSDDSWGSSTGDSFDSWDSEPTSDQQPKDTRPQYTPVIFDYLLKEQNQYQHPELDGPAIELIDTRFMMATPYDSLKMTSLKANFLLKSRTLVGSQASLEWPARNHRFRGAVVQLSDFHIKKDRSDFRTPNAKLQFDKLTGGQIEGVFEFKSTRRPKRALNSYPIFTSNKADLDIKLTDDKVRYHGGIQLKGNELFGKSVSREIGTLSILDGKGNTVVLRSTEFVLGDSLLSMDQGTITILHGGDSITHKSVRAKFDLETRELKVLRNSTLTPFRSSYFDIELDLDLITWKMDKDLISAEIMNGKDLLPASFESADFFDEIRYRKIARALDFHPINVMVHYALKYRREEFYVPELAMEYEMSESHAKAAAKILDQYGFADYNSQTNFIKLYPKAFHYYNSSAKKVDYDNLMVPSKVKDGTNGVILLDSGMLKVRGVSRFYITTDFKVYAKPYDSTLTLLKGRNLEFNGEVVAGDLAFQGKGHQFDYSEFIFKMPQIDSIRFTVPLRDTTSTDTSFKQAELDNQLTATSGTLFIDQPGNRSGRVKNNVYPYFTSDSEAVFYFDGKEILNGAYDRSVRFIVPPFEMDSVERKDGESMSFEGIFNSGGIFPTFEETLHIQEDKSLGFRHRIPKEGYNLYGTEARTYEEISLSNKGMRGYGQIDFLTTTIYSDDFIYYPDSVTTNGSGGVITPGNYKRASYPEAVLGAYDMYWLPAKDSMYLRSVGEPFKFYNSTAELDGFANITTNGVYGGGTMLTRGSRAESNELSFKEYEYSARHAKFEVLTDDPSKPAMEGNDIKLSFNLVNNTARVSPEKVGVAAITFPYAQMKTSMSEAVWDLEDSVVTMVRPKNVSIEDSYFYTTRPELDSLAFNAEKAIYDINTKELNVQGIPYIIVADSKIIPENNQTTILANSVLQEFRDAKIIIDTLNGYHYLDRANIRILSRNSFIGNAYYRQIVNKDTFDIKFNSFQLQKIPVGEPDKKGNYQKKLMTVSGGEVAKDQDLIISPGFFYKGPVVMYASNPALELDGYIKLDLTDPGYDEWVRFKREAGKTGVELDADNAVFEGGEAINAGVHIDIRGELYSTFIEKKKNSSDIDFYKASGILTFDETTRTYRVEYPLKTEGRTYMGSTMIYNDSSKSVVYEGLATFINPLNTQIRMKSSILGGGNKVTNEFSVDLMTSLDLPYAPVGAMDLMAEDLIEIIEKIGPPLANNISDELLRMLANFTNEDITRAYEQESLKKYVPLYSTSRELEKAIFISGTKMKWHKEQKAWYSTTQIGISNIFKHDLNAVLDGFLEIKKDGTGTDIVSLFIQAAPGVWYYFEYTANQLILFSSNPKFNEEIKSKSNVGKAKPEELVLALGDENETLSFINAFRGNYLGVNESYNLVFPDDVSTEDEELKTIEEEANDDDGFGFE